MDTTDIHTDIDQACFDAANIDSATSQPRDHAVRCVVCLTLTWNLSATCTSDHYRPPGRVERIIESRKAHCGTLPELSAGADVETSGTGRVE